MSSRVNPWISEPGTRPASPQIAEPRLIGRILIDLGKLRPEEAEEAFALHRRKGIRFGEAALRLRFITPTDLEQALAIQFGYPRLQAGESLLAPELILAYEPESAPAETVRDLRSQLLTRWFNGAEQFLVIASAQPGDGRSYVAANLAVAFAQWQGRTLLIDADLRTPRQHRMFGLPDEAGLSTILNRRAGPEVIRPILAIGNLSLLPAGPIPPNPQELLGRPAFARLCHELAEEYEFILLDSPAALRGSDAQLISARAGGALVVARENHTRLAEIDEVARRISGHGAKVVGTVLNRH
ncbi:MAG TPA: chain length determinant protein tyrosine kinase EpsG [Steroidobacteraceae bacterium]|nr:chain length determinant protein tyrosine kinase EpsG [Steroidobacteraceae bacterium]